MAAACAFVLLVSAAGVIARYAILGCFGTAPRANGQERTAIRVQRAEEADRAPGIAAAMSVGDIGTMPELQSLGPNRS